MTNHDIITKLEECIAALKANTPLVAQKQNPTSAELKAQFDWVSPSYENAVFTDNVDDSNGGEAELMHFDEYLSTDAVLKKIKEAGKRPATFRECIAWAKENPDEQRKFPILALGSTSLFGGGRRVVYLDECDRQRNAHLCWIGDGGGWFSSCRFLVKRK